MGKVSGKKNCKNSFKTIPYHNHHSGFLAEHTEFSLLPFDVGELHSDGMLTLTPALHGTDGFFIAKLQKGR